MVKVIKILSKTIMKYFNDITFDYFGYIENYATHISNTIPCRYTLEYISDGEMYYAAPGCETVNIKAPAVHWHFPGQKYSYGPLEGKRWGHYFVHIMGPRANRIFKMIRDEFSQDGYMMLRNGYEFEFQFKKLMEMLNRGTSSAHVKAVAVLENIIAMLCMESQLSFKCPHQQAILELLDNICSTPEKYHSVDQLAEIVYLSKPHFCRLFKKYTGRTVYSYILSCKMRKAADMLRNSDNNVTEVARSLGYEDLPQFSKLFYKQTGMRPRDIVKNYIKS